MQEKAVRNGTERCYLPIFPSFTYYAIHRLLYDIDGQKPSSKGQEQELIAKQIAKNEYRIEWQREYIKAFGEKYGTPQISGAQVSQPITVHITLPVTAAESAMIRAGDMSGLGTSVGKTVSDELSKFTPNTH